MNGETTIEGRLSLHGNHNVLSSLSLHSQWGNAHLWRLQYDGTCCGIVKSPATVDIKLRIFTLGS